MYTTRIRMARGARVFDRQGIDHRKQREGEEQADDEELGDAPDPPHEVQREHRRHDEEHDPQHSTQGWRPEPDSDRVRTVVGPLACRARGCSDGSHGTPTQRGREPQSRWDSGLSGADHDRE